MWCRRADHFRERGMERKPPTSVVFPTAPGPVLLLLIAVALLRAVLIEQLFPKFSSFFFKKHRKSRKSR